MLGFTFGKPMRVRKMVDFKFFLLQAPRSLIKEIEREREREREMN